MKVRVPASFEELNEAIGYDPISGNLHWRVACSNVKAGALITSVEGGGYVQLKFRGKRYLGHRVAWLLSTGEWPIGEIDHINGHRSDNRLSNLRDVSKANNQRNRLKPLGVNPYPNVRRQKNRWTAAFKINRKTHWVGSFDTPEAARAAVVLAKNQLL